MQASRLLIYRTTGWLQPQQVCNTNPIRTSVPYHYFILKCAFEVGIFLSLSIRELKGSEVSTFYSHQPASGSRAKWKTGQCRASSSDPNSCITRL